MSKFTVEVGGRSRKETAWTMQKEGCMTVHVRGWSVGIRVEIGEHEGKEVVHVFRTNGGADDRAKHLVSVAEEASIQSHLSVVGER